MSSLNQLNEKSDALPYRQESTGLAEDTLRTSRFFYLFRYINRLSMNEQMALYVRCPDPTSALVAKITRTLIA
jgi:hypothetical protein